MHGRPPLRPFLRAAAAFAGEDFRPPMRPSSASHSGPVNTEERRPGTLRSRSRLSQCKPPPRPRISTARTSRTAAALRLGISFTGKVTAAPFVSSIRRTFSRARYWTSAARGSPEICDEPHWQDDCCPVRELDLQCALTGAVRDVPGSQLRLCSTAPGAGRPSEIRTQLLLYPVRYQM